MDPVCSSGLRNLEPLSPIQNGTLIILFILFTNQTKQFCGHIPLIFGNWKSGQRPLKLRHS